MHLERIAGGNETEVYLTDDARYVVKVKDTPGGTLAEALEEAKMLAAAANEVHSCLGAHHTIPNYVILSGDENGRVHPVVIQPFLPQGEELFKVDYSSLTQPQRILIAEQLRQIIRCSARHYHLFGRMPDLYGRASHSKKQRRQRNAPHLFPVRVWSFLIWRSLLRSHNLMRLPDSRIVLVDYDPIQRSWLYKTIYFAVRYTLFLRDRFLIQRVEKGYRAPKAID
ncbi:MAG: hypothetical protein L0332_06405 [Chloroflexi bacterium]|nr:hypothetical protein [Chloroflexota bacterium]MCI0646537.1 hypothetical protein [Chloroflexota bacterium]MCI0726339.1 hypothetical protein [Chloroflexota bacterium]